MAELKESMEEAFALLQKKRKEEQISKYGHILTEEESEYYAEQKRLAETEEEKRKAEEQRKKKIKLEVEKWISNLPKRYKNASFSTFEAKNEERKKIKEFMMKCESAILYGSNGTGKTHLGYSACLEVVKQGKKAILVKAFPLFSNIKKRFANNTVDEYLKELTTVDYLVVDEADKKQGSLTDFIYLSEIIGERYDECLPTVIITNSKFEDLIELLGTSVIDRIAGDGKIIELNGKSYRMKH